MKKTLVALAILTQATLVGAGPRDHHDHPRPADPVQIADRLVAATDDFYEAAEPHRNHNRQERRAVGKIYQLHQSAHEYLATLTSRRPQCDDDDGAYRDLIRSFERADNALDAIYSCDRELERSYRRVASLMHELIDAVNGHYYDRRSDWNDRHDRDDYNRARSTRPYRSASIIIRR